MIKNRELVHTISCLTDVYNSFRSDESDKYSVQKIKDKIIELAEEF